MGLFRRQNRRIEQTQHEWFGSTLDFVGKKLRAAGPYIPMVLVLLVLGILGVRAGYFVSATPYFNLKQVHIEGANLLSEEEILKSGHIQMDSHLLHLNTREINQALSQNPWITASSVEINLPDRMLIKVKEKTPEALLLMGELYLIDSKGNVITRAGDRPHRWDLPVISGIDRELFLNPDPALQAQEKQKLATALELLKMYGEHRWLLENAALSEIHTDRIMGFSLITMGDKITVQLGNGDFHNKLLRFKWVLQDLKAKGEQVSYILLDNDREPDRVVVRLASQPEDT